MPALSMLALSMISIPEGAIKSTDGGKIHINVAKISIPEGAIKRTAKSL